MEEWNIFVRRWEVFRSGSDIDGTSAPSQLLQCAGTESQPHVTSQSLENLLL